MLAEGGFKPFGKWPICWGIKNSNLEKLPLRTLSRANCLCFTSKVASLISQFLQMRFCESSIWGRTLKGLRESLMLMVLLLTPKIALLFSCSASIHQYPTFKNYTLQCKKSLYYLHKLKKIHTICLVVNINTRKLKPITIVCQDHCKLIVIMSPYEILVVINSAWQVEWC